MFNGWQFDVPILQAHHAEGKTQPVNSKLEIRAGRRVVPLLDEVGAAVDLAGIQGGRQATEMEGRFGQMGAMAF